MRKTIEDIEVMGCLLLRSAWFFMSFDMNLVGGLEHFYFPIYYIWNDHPS